MSDTPIGPFQKIVLASASVVLHRGGKGLVLVHRCVVCGFVRPNRIADDPVQGDDIEAIIGLISKAW